MIYLNKKRKLYPIKLDKLSDPFLCEICGKTNQPDYSINFSNLIFQIRAEQSSDVFNCNFNRILCIDADYYEIVSIPEIEGFYTPDVTGLYGPDTTSRTFTYEACKLTINQTGLSGTGYATVRYTMWKSGKQIEKQVQYGNSIYVPWNTEIIIEPSNDDEFLSSDILVFDNINKQEYNITCRYNTQTSVKPVQKYLYRTEYIENINNDYILTDIIPKGNQTVYYKIKINETNTTKPYFGGRTAIGSSVITLWQISGKIRKDFGSNGKAESETIVPGTIYESSIGNSSGSFTSNSPFALFTTNTGNVIDTRKGICCIYYIQIFDENNNLIYDLQPFRYDDNKGCIRDMVTGKVYYSNSGNITAG